jgi:hypothetical protein
VNHAGSRLTGHLAATSDLALAVTQRVAHFKVGASKKGVVVVRWDK